jgi:hypothetical protein
MMAAALFLLAMAGLRNMQGVYLVGKAGSGAPYTTIQAAIDEVNGATSSATNPALILIGPGVYTELLTIDKDGLVLVGLGGVTINNGVAVDHTVTIDNGALTPPQQVVFQNLKITNDAANRAAIRVSGGAASAIGAGGIWVKDCHLVNVTGGGYTLWATAINNLYIQGGTQLDSDPAAILRVDQCALATVDGVTSLPIVQMGYDSGGTIPATAGSAYRVSSCPAIGQLGSTLAGAGSLSVYHCTAGTTTLAGDQSVTFQHAVLGNLTVDGTVACTLTASTRGTAVGSGTLAEPVVQGTLTYVADTVASFTFDVAGPDAAYRVAVELPSAPAFNAVPVVENKTAAGFDVTFLDSTSTPIAQTFVLPVAVTRTL